MATGTNLVEQGAASLRRRQVSSQIISRQD
jgi:hypothetical protein